MWEPLSERRLGCLNRGTDIAAGQRLPHSIPFSSESTLHYGTDSSGPSLESPLPLLLDNPSEAAALKASAEKNGRPAQRFSTISF